MFYVVFFFKSYGHHYIYFKLHHLYNSQRARVECGRSWIGAAVESNQTLKLVVSTDKCVLNSHFK